MQDTSQVNPACDLRAIREAVCVHTDKITDSCLAKDCIEDLHVYLTVDSQHALDCSNAARARFVELLHVGVQVEAVPFNTGRHVLLPHHRRRIRPGRTARHHHGPGHFLKADGALWR